MSFSSSDPSTPAAGREPNLRRDLARLLDNLYGLAARPHHVQAFLDVFNVHAPVKVPLSAASAEGTEQALKAAKMLNDYADMLDIVREAVGAPAEAQWHRGFSVEQIRATSKAFSALQEAGAAPASAEWLREFRRKWHIDGQHGGEMTECFEASCLSLFAAEGAARATPSAPLASAPASARQRIVCLCGSTRFIEQFATATWVLELQGYIVLGCTLLPTWFCGVRSHFAEAQGVKEQRDDHHKRKIDLADEVLVLDIGGYIGESTRNEIAYAAATGKPVRYVSADAELLSKILPSAPLVSPQGEE